MEKKKCLVLVILALVLLGAQVGTTQGALCEGESQKFRFPCFSDKRCARVCGTEGFPDGHCKGLRHRCFCRKPC